MDSGIHKVYRLDNQPFAQIPRHAIRNPRVTQNAFRLLAYLMSHQHGYDLTYGQIERETALGRFAINGAIQCLTELGWLKVERPKLSNGQFGAKAWYVLDPDEASTVGNSTVEQPHMGQPTDNKNKNTSKNKTTKNTYPQAVLEEAFDNFWKYYPRKVEKLDARRAFNKHYEEYGQKIQEGVERLASDPNLPPKQFVPYPASWLNAGGWENEPYPVRELSKAEQAAKVAEAQEQRREREREARERQRAIDAAERERVKAELEANPVPRCEHDKILYACKLCWDTPNNRPRTPRTA